MKPEQRKQLREIIWNLETLDDLTEAGELVKERWNHLVKKQATSFKPGDRVGWKHEGRSYSGHVIKSNVKTVDVEEDDSGREWRITASELNSL